MKKAAEIIDQMKRTILLFFSLSLLWTCTGLDDQPLPADARGQITFQTFEVNAERGYVLVKLVNDSPYILTSCKFRVNIYSAISQQSPSPVLPEVSAAESVATGKKTAERSENFFIRQILKPGYSTEVYFEWALDDLQGAAVYTKEIIDLKGRIKP